MKRSIEPSLNRWFASHHGVLTVQEAAALGLTRHDLYALVKRRRLDRRHAGVYLEQPLREGRFVAEAAAALAAGGVRSALSHRSAAWHWELLEAPPARVELLVPYGARSTLRGVVVHRSRISYRTRSRDGLRVTEPVRTVVDLAATHPRVLTEVVDRALASRILRLSDLEAAAQPDGRKGPVVGAANLRRHLDGRGYIGAPTPSVLESQMARLVAQAGLEVPAAEYTAGEAGEYRLDFAYPVIRLALEVDGYAWHWDPDRMAADLARRNRLANQGWRILVFTWKQVQETPDEVVAEIRAAYGSLVGA